MSYVHRIVSANDDNILCKMKTKHRLFPDKRLRAAYRAVFSQPLQPVTVWR